MRASKKPRTIYVWSGVFRAHLANTCYNATRKHNAANKGEMP